MQSKSDSSLRKVQLDDTSSTSQLNPRRLQELPPSQKDQGTSVKVLHRTSKSLRSPPSVSTAVSSHKASRPNSADFWAKPVKVRNQRKLRIVSPPPAGRTRSLPSAVTSVTKSKQIRVGSKPVHRTSSESMRTTQKKSALPSTCKNNKKIKKPPSKDDSKKPYRYLIGG